MESIYRYDEGEGFSYAIGPVVTTFEPRWFGLVRRARERCRYRVTVGGRDFHMTTPPGPRSVAKAIDEVRAMLDRRGIDHDPRTAYGKEKQS